MSSAVPLGFRSLYRIFGVLTAVAIAAAFSARPAAAQTPVAQFSYAEQTLGGGFSFPVGVAVDANGNVFVADGGAVKEVPDGCATASCVNTLPGDGSAAGVAVDANGNVFVANAGNNAAEEIPVGCTTVSCIVTLGGGFSVPTGVAVDANGNVFVADQNNNAVKEIPVGCITASCVVALGGGFANPVGVAVDANGNVFVADYGNNTVKEIPDGCTAASCVVTLGGGFSFPEGVEVDGYDNIIVADSGNNAVKEIPVGCTTASCVVTLGGGFGAPEGVAVDEAGNVFVADAGNDAVKEIELHGVDFGTEPIGSTSAAIPLTFTFNSSVALGAPQALTMGATGQDFNIVSGGSCASGTAEAAGDTCTVNVAFTAFFPGERKGAVNLTDLSTGAVIATAYVHGVGEGPQVVFEPGTTTTLGAGYGAFGGAIGVAVDGSDNVYIAGLNDPTITKVPAGCVSASCVLTLGGGLNDPQSLAVDGADNVYVGDSLSSVVKEIPAGCASASCVVALGGGLGAPEGVAVDGSGNIYVADLTGAVKEIPVDCTSASCVKTLGGGFSSPVGVAVDGSGNVYVADFGNNAVKEIPASCIAGANNASCVKTLGGGSGGPQYVAVDGTGNLYVSNGNSPVEEMPAGCTSSGCVKTIGDTFTAGIAVDGSGNVYMASTFSGSVLEYNRTMVPASAMFFGPVNVGATSSSGMENATLENIGNEPLTFPIPTMAGTYNPSVAANFSYDDSSTCLQASASSATPFTLAAGASCTVVIDFAPTTVGSITGTLNITDNNLNAAAPNYAVQQIPLSGTGVQAVTQLIFGISGPASLTAGGNAGKIMVTEDDSTGNPVNTATDTITLTVTGPGGYSKTYTATAAAGDAIFDLSSVALNAAGSYTYTATTTTSGITEATITKTVTAAAASTITAIAGGGLSTAINTAFPENLVVKVTDSFGNPVAGATVTFTAPTSGASATLSTPATTASDGETHVTPTANGTAGTYTVTASTTGASAPATFSLTNTKATATVTLGDLSQTYTGSPLTATATTNPAGLAVSFTYNGSATAPTHAGSYTVVATINDPTHTGTATGTLVIGKAIPGIAWATPTPITSGTALSATQLDATATANGKAVPGTFVYTPAAGTILSVGTHTLSVQFTPSDTVDFLTPAAIQLTITVTQPTLTVMAANATRVFGAANPTFTGTVTGAVNGDTFTEAFTTTATATSNAGSYPIVPSVTGANLASYTVKAVNGTLTITQAATTTTLSAGATSLTPGQSLTLTAKVADASTGSTGAPTGMVTFFDGTTQLGTASLAGGVATYTDSTLASGTHSFTAVYGGDTNFLASKSASAIPIPVEALTFSLNLTGGQGQTVVPGSPAGYTFEITPTYGAYPGVVSFTATGLPAGATATFSPATIPANGGAQTVTMTIQTPPPATSAENHKSSPFRRGGEVALGFLLVPFLGLRKRKRWMRMLSIVLLIVGMGAITGLVSGCGSSGFFGQQQKSYQVTVTATSGTVSQSSVVTLNVE